MEFEDYVLGWKNDRFRAIITQNAKTMVGNSTTLASSDDVVDLREVFAALRRRWLWIFGGGLLGLAFAAGFNFHGRFEASLFEASLIVDTSLSPCNFSRRSAIKGANLSLKGLGCAGEIESTRFLLNWLAREKFDKFETTNERFAYNVEFLPFDGEGRDRSSTQLLLKLDLPVDLVPEVSLGLAQIQKFIVNQAAQNAEIIGEVLRFGDTWIIVNEPSEIDANTLERQLSLGLLGGLLVGVCSALISDSRSKIVYAESELLRRLGYPLRLGLPSAYLGSPVVRVLVGQLATQLDQTLSWRVLSIARQHQAVTPLTQLLQDQGGADLQCNSADPLLSEVLRFDPSDQPTGLLLVVEGGFNSSRALEEARLLISQMSKVQAVGVLLIGVPLPQELSASAAG